MLIINSTWLVDISLIYLWQPDIASKFKTVTHTNFVKTFTKIICDYNYALSKRLNDDADRDAVDLPNITYYQPLDGKKEIQFTKHNVCGGIHVPSDRISYGSLMMQN